MPPERIAVLADAASYFDGELRLTRIAHFGQVMRYLLYARERFDGGAGGFPGALSGTDVPLESRIISVAIACCESALGADWRQSAGWMQAQLSARAGADLDPA